MAAFISYQPSDNFTTVKYTGDGTSPRSITTGFQSDLLWTKNTTSNPNLVWNSVTGSGADTELNPDSSVAMGAKDANLYGYLSAFASTTYAVTTGATNDNYVNDAAYDYYGWGWKAGTTSGIATNGSTTITPSAYSFNQTTGISIIKYTGNVTAGAKLAHGLGAIPHTIFVKCLDSTNSWFVYHRSNFNGWGSTNPQNYHLVLNSDSAKVDSTSGWNDTKPDSVNITLGTGGEVNSSGVDYIAYCFTSKPGFSHFGAYRGHALNADGAFCPTGFRPNYLIIKNNEGGDIWISQNIEGNTYNPCTTYFQPSGTSGGVTAATYAIDFCSNGFKIRSTINGLNYTNQTFNYWAWAEFPMVSSNDIPGVAR